MLINVIEGVVGGILPATILLLVLYDLMLCQGTDSWCTSRHEPAELMFHNWKSGLLGNFQELVHMVEVSVLLPKLFWRITHLKHDFLHVLFATRTLFSKLFASRYKEIFAVFNSEVHFFRPCFMPVLGCLICQVLRCFPTKAQ